MQQKKHAIYHFEHVDLSQVKAVFSTDNLHRASLRIPLFDRETNRTLCVIGQNPSDADEKVADKTIRFLEEYVFKRLPQYSELLMLNLYSRIDTKKSETENLIDAECERILFESLRNHTDFLVAFGQLKSKGSYNFLSRARKIQSLMSGKSIFKFNLDTPYAPHPRNPRILYSNFDVSLNQYDFSDC